MRRRFAVLLPAAVAFVALLCASEAGAVVRTFRYTLPNPGPILLGPGAARRLVVRPIETPFIQGGESTQLLTLAQVVTNVPGCGIPSVTVVADSVAVVWPTDCVDPGEFVVLRITTTGSELTCGTGYWRHSSGVVIGNAVCQPLPLPGVTSVGASVLAMALAIAGGLLLRRRESGWRAA